MKAILTRFEYQTFRQAKRFGARVSLRLRLGLAARQVLSLTVAALVSLGSVTAAHASSSDWPYLHTANAPHDVRVLNDGLVSFEQRLEMLEGAKSSIDFMVYLFGTDESSRLTLHTLMRKALEGVHVRLYLDWYTGAGQPDITEDIVTAVQRELARLAGPSGVRGSFEVRYYNRGELIKSLGRINHRNHAKVLVVDGEQVLVGGRNISNDYFSLEKKGWEYIDRELWVRSTSSNAAQNIALQAKAAFDMYWSDQKWTSKAKLLQPEVAVSERAASVAKLGAGGELPEFQLREQVRVAAARKPLETFQVKHATFAIDKPGHAKEDRVLTPALDRLLNATDRYLMIENYSLPMSDRRLKLMKSIADRSVPVVILTNGYESHDSLGVSAFSQPQEAALLKSSKNVWMWAFKGKALARDLRLENRELTDRFSTHTKTFVSFSSTGARAAVGSYNFDVRSEKTNNEAMIVIEDPAVVANIVEDIQYRTENSRPLVVGAGDRLMYADTMEYQKRYVSDFKKFIRAIGLWKLMRSLY